MDPLFLPQLIGLYLIIVGAIAAFRRSSVMPAIAELVKNKGLIVAIAFIELAAGLGVILTYPNITYDWRGLISLIGWMLVIESILYLALPFRMMRNMIESFNVPVWYVAGGLLSIIAGAYLAGVGFQII